MTEVPPSDDQQDSDRINYDKQVVESSNARVGLDPDGAYITSWKVRNPQTKQLEDVLYIGKTKKRTGIPTLFPYYGEGGKMRTHGFGRDSKWQVMSAFDNQIVLRLRLEDLDEEARAEFPHPFDSMVAVTADNDGSLLYDLTVTNPGTEDLPLSPGLHPYWAINHADKGSIRVEGLSGFDASKIDWDHNPPDTEYDYTGPVTVIFPNRQIRIEDQTPGGPVIKKIVAWSQTPDKDDSDFACFEPVSGGDNTINENPILVKPGASWNMRIKFTATPTQ